MKRMKLLSLGLVFAMSVSLLAACGGSSSDTTTDESAQTTTEESAAATDSSSDASADSAAADYSNVEEYEIQFSSTFQEAETGGIILQHFADTLSDMTGGKMTVNFSWGGTLYDTSGELDAVSSGAVDMVALGHMPHIDVLNYLAFPGFAPGDTQSALDYFNGLIFDDEETSALIQGEAADNNIIYLNVIAGGANAFCAKNEFTDLDSLISGSSSFGNMDAAIFEKLGFQVSAVGPGDTYQAFQSGQIDASQMGFAPMVAMGWQDVASYWALDGTYTAGNMFTFNLDKWNALSADQQAAVQAAATETEEYSAGIYDDAIDADKATVEEATGNTFVEFSQDDIDRIWAATFEAKAESALTTAEPNGKTEGMTTILQKAAELTGYDWSAE